MLLVEQTDKWQLQLQFGHLADLALPSELCAIVSSLSYVTGTVSHYLYRTICPCSRFLLYEVGLMGNGNICMDLSLCLGGRQLWHIVFILICPRMLHLIKVGEGSQDAAVNRSWDGLVFAGLLLIYNFFYYTHPNFVLTLHSIHPSVHPSVTLLFFFSNILEMQ